MDDKSSTNGGSAFAETSPEVSPEVSIVMPCLNEAETLKSCIDKALEAIKKHRLNAEIIIADNGSTDGSPDIALKSGALVVHVKTKGYGAALSGGIAAARGKYIIMGDADDSYDFGNIYPFVEKLREGFDLVMGCRLPSGGGTIMPGAMPLKHRFLGNPVLSFVGRLFFKSPVTDFHCGMRAFGKKAFDGMDLHTTGMEFASEMIIKATLLNMKITEIPITLYKDGRSRPPHLRSWRDGWRHLRFMLMYSPAWLFLLPGGVLFVSGAALFPFLTKGPLSAGTVIFDTNTLLVSAMAILLGFQLIAFYIYTKTFAISEGFIPADKRFEKILEAMRLEAGIVIGIALILAGMSFLVASIIIWAKTGFGQLSYPESLRKVIPAVTLTVLGVQIIFSSFFISILLLRRKP